jgi:chromosomal replication initiator protein
MTTSDAHDSWNNFLEFAKKRCSPTAFGNWLAPIKVLAINEEELTLEVPNIFVKEYLLTNYSRDLCAFVPVNAKGEPNLAFVVTPPSLPVPTTTPPNIPAAAIHISESTKDNYTELKLNSSYRFENFIEGPTNQFVKSAAMGIAARPGQSYNPFLIHGPVGNGKTLSMQCIAHYLGENHKNLKVKYITTEAFINDLVDSLRHKSVDKIKRFYRSDIDVLLIDDIQFLQNRLNFEEEFCHTFETLINQRKQIVITSDKPPAQLKLSERMIARMEWGLVAHLGIPELETRVAILQHKAKARGLEIPNEVAFYIAEHIYSNVRQLEGAVNKLCAHCRLLNKSITQELAASILKDMMQQAPQQKVSVEQVLKLVASFFQVRISDLKGTSRTKEIALARQIAMYLCCKLINESLQMLGACFGKTHSTLLHACKAIEKRLASDEMLRRQVSMVERQLVG